jgi:Delta14-sterol reductase
VVQYETYGTLSTAMVLYQIFTLVYIFNYFQFEYGMLHTWDMVAERFGGMLIWGDYVLVPFFYSLPGWFLVHRLEPLPAWAAVGLMGLFLFGFCLFRGANGQKHRFKLDPATRIWGRPAETIGGRLLVSGLWGLGRHLNYSGEIVIYLAFALTTGFDSVVPYLLPAWLGALLIHRARRDERRCRAKYGDLWTRYTRRVPFRMLPLVY